MLQVTKGSKSMLSLSATYRLVSDWQIRVRRLAKKRIAERKKKETGCKTENERGKEREREKENGKEGKGRGKEGNHDGETGL